MACEVGSLEGSSWKVGRAFVRDYNLRMRRNPTLPTIRESISAVGAAKAKEGAQSYRKIEDKINSHDEQIVKNEKIISNLANDFRLLKEQLEFEQQYNEKYKNTMNKYEEDTAKHLKVIRDQKQLVAKLEHLSKEKDKNIELANKERAQLRERIEEQTAALEEHAREAKRREAAIKGLEMQLEKARKEIKEKQSELKQKEAQIREAFVSDRQIRESKVKKLEKDMELLNVLLENSKEQLIVKDREIQRLSNEVFHAEERLKGGDKHEVRAKALLEEVKLAQRESEDLRRKLKEQEDQTRALEVALKTMESKSNTTLNEKSKQLHQEKKELLDKLERSNKEVEEWKRKVEAERKAHKLDQETKEKLVKLESFYERVGKSRAELGQQLTTLRGNIQCDYCGKPMKNPVTNIPCGHSYCQDCKAGYLKECRKCQGVKREAVYRNELLDEIIQAAGAVERLMALLSG